MIKVHKLKQAKSFFNNLRKNSFVNIGKNIETSIICTRGNQEFIAHYYAEAEEFYRSEMKSPEVLIIKEIQYLELEIEKCDENLNSINSYKLNNPEMITTIEIHSKKPIQKIEKMWQDKIQEIIKQHPEVEPLYIMHQITK